MELRVGWGEERGEIDLTRHWDARGKFGLIGDDWNKDLGWGDETLRLDVEPGEGDSMAFGSVGGMKGQ